MSLLVWNPDHVFELSLAIQTHVNLFDDAEIVTDPVPHNIKNDKRTKIVLKDWWLWEGTNKPPEDLSWADLVICYTGELVNGPWDWYYNRTIEQFNNKNFISVSNGRYGLTNFPDQMLYDDLGHFFSKIANVCRYQDWNTLDHKPKLFDALLGIAKPHRIFIFNQLLANDLLDKSFVNIHGSTNYRSPELEAFDDPAITDHNRTHSMDNVLGLENGNTVSHSIPQKIYQNSWYSIVAETNPSQSNFLTEKTGKPLFSKKLFVLFGSLGLLGRLHTQGYKTFNGIIDESYDNEPDDIKRWTMAFDQVIKLSNFDHEETYKKIEPILVHNHNHICDHHYRLRGLKEFLNQHLIKF
jgi:hypothetical protein